MAASSAHSLRRSSPLRGQDDGQHYGTSRKVGTIWSFPTGEVFSLSDVKSDSHLHVTGGAHGGVCCPFGTLSEWETQTGSGTRASGMTGKEATQKQRGDTYS